MTKKQLAIQIDDLSRRVSGLYATTDYLSGRIDRIMNPVPNWYSNLCGRLSSLEQKDYKLNEKYLSDLRDKVYNEARLDGLYGHLGLEMSLERGTPSYMTVRKVKKHGTISKKIRIKG